MIKHNDVLGALSSRRAAAPGRSDLGMNARQLTPSDRSVRPPARSIRPLERASRQNHTLARCPLAPPAQSARSRRFACSPSTLLPSAPPSARSLGPLAPPRERAGRAAFGSLWRVSGARRCRVSLPTATTVKLQDAFPRAVLLGWAVRVRVRWEARESARVPLLHSGPTPPPAAAFRSVGWTALVLGRRRRRRSWPRMAFAEWATQPGREKEAREAQNQLLSLHVRLLQYTRYVLSSRIGRMAAAAAACDATAPPYSALPPPPS